MPAIRYVCLSDLHPGADNSILTAIKPGGIETDPSRPSAVLSQFALCLRELLAHNETPEKPTLILNGDILELALTDVNKAAMVFERFIELIFPRDDEALFQKDILYLPATTITTSGKAPERPSICATLRVLSPATRLTPPITRQR